MAQFSVYLYKLRAADIIKQRLTLPITSTFIQTFPVIYLPYCNVQGKWFPENSTTFFKCAVNHAPIILEVE